MACIIISMLCFHKAHVKEYCTINSFPLSLQKHLGIAGGEVCRECMADGFTSFAFAKERHMKFPSAGLHRPVQRGIELAMVRHLGSQSKWQKAANCSFRKLKTTHQQLRAS